MKEWKRTTKNGYRIMVSFTLTNWTVGIWWDTKRLRAGGIDLGPLEFVYRKVRKWDKTTSRTGLGYR